jgi:hypothetical protein
MDSARRRGLRPTLSAMEINGTPLHPLVIHAVVVLVPLAALAGFALAVPRYRWLARWPALVLTLMATASTYVARISGHDLEHDRELHSPLVHTHEEWGDRLMLGMLVFAALVVVAFWVLPHVTRLSGGRDRQAKAAALEKPLMVLVPLVAVAVLVLVVLTGDAGARAVWQQ